MRDVLRETLHVELRREPLALYRQLRTASGLTIDDDWSIGELDSLLSRSATCVPTTSTSAPPVRLAMTNCGRPTPGARPRRTP